MEPMDLDVAGAPGDAPPSHEAERLWREYASTGRTETRDRIVEAYLPLVRRMAEGISARFDLVVDVNSLVSVGAFGLIHEVERRRGEGDDAVASFERECLSGVEASMLEGIRRYRWRSGGESRFGSEGAMETMRPEGAASQYGTASAAAGAARAMLRGD